ncbi:MAG: Ig-like domain repeat protein, partial [Saezia sp.]
MMTTNCQKYKIPKGLTDWKKQKERYPKKGWKPFKAVAIAAATVLCGLSSQAVCAQTVNIYANKPQTNEAPGWRWRTSEPVDQCRLSIQNKAGGIVYNDILYNTLEFAYTDGIVHNETYRANVQCSKDGGETWGYSTWFVAPITVDTVPPRIELNTFKRNLSGYLELAYATMDDLVGGDDVHVQIARDRDFTDLVYDERRWGATSTSIYADLPEGVYYARISAVDRAGNHSAFSAAKEIHSSNDYAQMSVTALRTFTNQAPEWGWVKIDGFDVYKIEIQDSSGNILDSYEVGNNRFAYAAGLEHGKQFRARVKGSRDGGDSWEDWTALSDVITVDTQIPEVELMAFVKVFEAEPPSRKLGAVAKEMAQRNAENSDLSKYWRVNFGAWDELSDIGRLQIQIASDVNFSDVIANQEITDSYSIYRSYYDFYPDATMLGGEYFVRIKAVDQAGNETAFTPVRKLNTVAVDFDFQVNAKEFTNKAPEWSWPLIDGFNHYEVEVYRSGNEGNELVFEGPVGNVNLYTYTGAIAHGESYYFSVKGSKDGGLTWSEWKSSNTGTTIDLQTPEISLDSFSYIKYYNYDYTLQVNMNKDPRDLESMQVQIARDPQFEQLVFDETRMSYNISNYFSVDAGPLQGAFYARVKITDKAGNESAFTPARVIYSSGVEDFISNIYVIKSTRDTLEWLWTKFDNMNAFEVQIEDENGTVLHTERLGNVNHFIYHPHHASDGQVFYFTVKGSIDNGLTWGEESQKNLGYTVVDAIAPSVELNSFLRGNENYLDVYYSIVDDHYQSELQIQVATDSQFDHIVYDKTMITYSGNNRQYSIYDGNFPEQQYYARIKVSDFAGNESEFTPAVKMTEDLSVPVFAAFSRTINAAPQWSWI